MRLYIIRHADPDYVNNTITPAGHLEAQALARRLAGYSLTHIYSSPLQRALQTAQYTANLVKLEPVVEAWTQELSDLRIELDGSGMVVWDLPGEIVRAGLPYPTHDTWHTIDLLHEPRFRGAFARVQQHSDAFLQRHGYERQDGRYRCVRANQDQIAVFCHNGFGLTWLAHLLAVPLPLVWAGFWLPPSSVTTVLFEERSATWAIPRCLGVGDVAHLYQARLPVQPRGLKGNVR